MSETEGSLDDRIALVRRSISELTALATAASGAATEERLAARLNEQQELLNALLKERETLLGSKR